MLLFPPVPTSVCTFALRQLATVDYTVANRVTDDVARAVEWAYQAHVPWLPPLLVGALQRFDEIGGLLIALVVWLVNHAAS